MKYVLRFIMFEAIGVFELLLAVLLVKSLGMEPEYIQLGAIVATIWAIGMTGLFEYLRGLSHTEKG